jgi:hypothetical protein
MRAALTLARWLGPWTRPTSAPRGIADTTLGFGGDRGLTGRLYPPAGPMRRAYLMCPGLHPLGPDHPVLDRFCRILAAIRRERGLTASAHRAYDGSIHR